MKFLCCGLFSSFGFIALELLQTHHGILQIMRAIDRGQRPEIPDNCPLPYKQLIQRCWCRDPKLRPTFEQILEQLAAMTSL